MTTINDIICYSYILGLSRMNWTYFLSCGNGWWGFLRFFDAQSFNAINLHLFDRKERGFRLSSVFPLFLLMNVSEELFSLPTAAARVHEAWDSPPCLGGRRHQHPRSSCFGVLILLSMADGADHVNGDVLSNAKLARNEAGKCQDPSRIDYKRMKPMGTLRWT